MFITRYKRLYNVPKTVSYITVTLAEEIICRIKLLPAYLIIQLNRTYNNYFHLVVGNNVQLK